eukprot:TRINITY_DN3258_c0_g1_i1.p1 TRINITY_DN3258_c0_g1~~TRINITY_DN3258_c0_g1_i1.p1  ORF type:complete len:491 (-),score=100.60 TRINITY_DN3258_c0_g1_i1:16-1404(-)
MAPKAAEVPEPAADLTLHCLGKELSEGMTAKLGDKECKIMPWRSFVEPGRPCRYFVYKDEHDNVGPGTEVKPCESGGFELAGSFFELEELPSAESLSERPIDLEKGPEYQWFRDMIAKVKPVDASQKERPWVVVLMGCSGIGKTRFLNQGIAEHYDGAKEAVAEQLKDMKHPDADQCSRIPFGNIFFKQIDDIVRHGARDEFDALWNKCASMKDPDERYRTYWANKQHLFTRFALDKPPATESNPNPKSFEMRIGEEMLKLLTKPESPYNIAMETTGLGAGLVKGGLTAKHYAQYNKLVILHEIDDIEKAKKITHGRMIREILTRCLHGGEQFGTFLEVIHKKARATYNDCVKFGKDKNRELDEASSTEGRWFFHDIQQTWDLDQEVLERIFYFYGEDKLRSKLGDLQVGVDGSMDKDAFRDVMSQLGLSDDDIESLRAAVKTDDSDRICFKDVIEWLFERP